MSASASSPAKLHGVSFESRTAQLLCLAAAATAGAAAYGFMTRASWITSIWPWPEVGMSFTWLGSIALAIAAPLLCIGMTREFAALAGLSLNFFVVGAATAAYMGWRIWRWNDPIVVPMAESIFFALLGAGLFLWSRRLRTRDTRPMPTFVRVAFMAFVIVLVATGSAVVLQTERVFPWNLQAPTCTIFGFIFFGAAALFAHAVIHSRWADAAAPLWSFLAYDAALFLPYGRMLSGSAVDASAVLDDYGGAGADVNLTSLAVFIIVMVASSLVALYALFVHPATRIFRPHAAVAAAS